MTNVAVVLNARNEERYLERSLQTIMDQELKPYRVIVINDGSTDNTEQIISKFPTVELINNPCRDQSYLGQKELASVVNQGLRRLHDDEQCQYVWMTGGDITYPKEYNKDITSRMKEDQAVVASGVVKGEFSVVPRGFGRIVDCSFWKKFGMLYPVNYGWEGYLVLKARMLGCVVKSYPDIVMHTQRPTGTRFDAKRYYYYGLANKALGYTLSYTLLKAIVLSRRQGPMAALFMLKGYLSKYDDLYEEELCRHTRQTQTIGNLNFQYVKQFFLLKLRSSRTT